jgi:hypothetical protein
MKPNLTAGVQINNEGHIYFDNNPAVITNNVLNTIYDCYGNPIIFNKSTTCLG